MYVFLLKYHNKTGEQLRKRAMPYG
jgi:hypothetical protein